MKEYKVHIKIFIIYLLIVYLKLKLFLKIQKKFYSIFKDYNELLLIKNFGTYCSREYKNGFKAT